MTQLAAMPRLAAIGRGAIFAEMLAILDARGTMDRLVGVLDRPERAMLRPVAPVPVLGDLAALLALRPEIVVECAGHGAVRAFGATILRHGTDLLIASVGALADAALSAELAAAAQEGGGRLLVPSGAVAGLDGLLAARTAGLRQVTYRSLKPPRAWKGTPAEKLLDLDAVAEPTVFFSGSARAAAMAYPQNANVGATVALAGIGLEDTRVELIADPAAAAPLGIIEASGDFGRFRFETLAFASPANPKTSLLTAHSLVLAAVSGWCFPV